MIRFIAFALLTAFTWSASASPLELTFAVNVSDRQLGFNEPSDPGFSPRDVVVRAIISDAPSSVTNQAELSNRDYGLTFIDWPMAADLPSEPASQPVGEAIQSLASVQSYLQPPDVGSLFAVVDVVSRKFDDGLLDWRHAIMLTNRLNDGPPLGLLDDFDPPDLRSYLEGLARDQVPFNYQEFGFLFGPADPAPTIVVFRGTALLTRVATVPEPGTVLQILSGIATLAIIGARRRHLTRRT